MTFPTGAMLLFMGACPAGWAPPPVTLDTPVCRQEGDLIVCPNKMGTFSHDAPPPVSGAQYCVKQPEPAHD